MTDSQYYLVCFLLSTLLFHFIFNKLLKLKTHPKLPLSPPALPVIGHLHLLSSTFYKSLQKLSTQYGPIFNLRLGFSQCIVVSSASVAIEIFKTRDLSFADHQEIAFSEKTLYGNSGFFSAPYGQPERSRAVREKELARFLQNVFESAKRKEVVDLSVELMKLTNNMLCKMMASTSCSEKGQPERSRAVREKELARFLQNVFESAKRKEVVDLSVELMKLTNNILCKMMASTSCSEKGDEAERIRKIMKDIFRVGSKDLFVRSTGTSSEVILWTITELINHPSVFNKVREEINLVVGSTRLVDDSDVENLPYLPAVVKETLRLYPPLPVTTRKCRQSCEIRGFEIPQETMVLINLYAIMRDPNLWNNPNEFQPERFLVSSEKKRKYET
nr:cytochrome p450 [Quercus suber]